MTTLVQSVRRLGPGVPASARWPQLGGGIGRRAGAGAAVVAYGWYSLMEVAA